MRRLAATDIVLGLIAAAVLALSASAALASGPSPEERVGRLAASLRCPTCAGLSIADSPAPMAAQMRGVVAERIAAGDSDDDVRAYFVARYGRWILLDPPVAGIDATLWVAPLVVIAAGTALLTWRARRPASGITAIGPRSSLPPRLVSAGTIAFVVAAIAVPIALAVGPRLAGSEITGRPANGGPADVGKLEARVARQPGDAEALAELGDALLVAGRGPEAADRYRAALEIDRDNVRALLGVGAILLEADRPDAAVQAFDRVLVLVPDLPDGLLMRAVARVRLDGTVSPAVRADLRRFIELAPTDQRRAMAEALLGEPTSTQRSPSP